MATLGDHELLSSKHRLGTNRAGLSIYLPILFYLFYLFCLYGLVLCCVTLYLALFIYSFSLLPFYLTTAYAIHKVCTPHLGRVVETQPNPPFPGKEKKKVGYTKNWRDTLGMYYLTIYTPVPSEDRPKSPSARKDGKKENDEGGFVFCFRLSCRVFLFQTKNHNIQHITTPLRLLTSHLCMLHAIFFIVLLSRNFYIYI